MDLHKAAIKSDFVTYVDSKQPTKTNSTHQLSNVGKSYLNCAKYIDKDGKVNRKLKCTCRCTCTEKRNQNSYTKNANKNQNSSNLDICKDSQTNSNSGILPVPTVTDFGKSFSAQNSPIHHISVSQNNEAERKCSFSKSPQRSNIDFLNDNEKNPNYRTTGYSDVTTNKQDSSKLDIYDSPEMIEILRKLEMQSEKLKFKMDAIDGLRDGILKQLENALASEQTNVSLSSSDRTDSKDSGMASISNDQTKPVQPGNKLPVKSILKKTPKHCRSPDGIISNKIMDSPNLSNQIEIQTGNCSNWHWQRKIPQQTLYCSSSDRGKCRRRSFDINSSCFSNIGYNCYSHIDLTTDQNQIELLYNEK